MKWVHWDVILGAALLVGAIAYAVFLVNVQGMGR